MFYTQQSHQPSPKSEMWPEIKRKGHRNPETVRRMELPDKILFGDDWEVTNGIKNNEVKELGEERP